MATPQAALNNSACVFAIIFFLLLVVSEASLTHYVGGKKDGWRPQQKNTLKRKHVLNRWAENSRFQVGDYLEWNFDPSIDSVLEVTEEDYNHCNTQNPLKRFEGGKVRAHLYRPRSFFYISGVQQRCQLGENLHVVVLTPRNPPIAPGTVALPGRPVFTDQPCSASTGCALISSGISPLAPTSTAMQAGLLLFILTLLNVLL